MTRTLPSTFAESGGGTGWLSLPFGPSARTVPSATWTFTPWGIGTGLLPMRDISSPLPDVREDFAADLLLAGLAIGHHALGRGDERDAHAGQDRRNLVMGHVDAPARCGHPHQPGDHLLVAHTVLQIYAQRVLLAVLEDAEVLDEPLLLEQLRDADLQLAGGDVALLVLGAAGVANAREEIGDRIAAHAYQLAFTTPGTSPFRASSRKHRRHIWNFRMYARGRPQSLHR